MVESKQRVGNVRVILNAQPEAADLAITSIDMRGTPGVLNEFVLDKLGYVKERSKNNVYPDSKQLSNGFHLLRTGDKKPVLFIVTIGEGETKDLLRENLNNALTAHIASFADKKVWVPLLGTGSGRLSFDKSYSIISNELVSFSERFPSVQFILSIPDDDKGRSLLKQIDAELNDDTYVAKIEEYARSGRNFYLVDSSLGGDEQSDRFFKEGIWKNNNEKRFQELTAQVKAGDIFILKSSYVSVNYLRIKGVGVVKHNQGTELTIDVDWKVKNIQIDIPPREHYRNTIVKVDIEDVKHIIANIRVLKIDKEILDSIFNVAAANTTATTPETNYNASSFTGNCWLIKLNDNNWEIDKLKANDEFNFHSHTHDKQKRVGYESFQEVKEGDIVLGYAYGKMNAIVCRFEITEALHQNPSSGEVIGLRIAEIINPHIPSSSFVKKVNFADDLGTTSLKKLFPLSLPVFNEIANLASPPTGSVVTPGDLLAVLVAEGNHSETKDQLDFENDIGSLASIIAMKDVKPPLAIGLFGKWGSGKSFFMKQLKKKIVELKDYDKETYVQHVVHVEFNSWHYSDTNLWASMVTKIFDALDQYSKGIQQEEEQEDPIERMKRATEKIKVLNGQKAAIENKKQELEKEILDKEEEQKKKREKLEDLTGFKILKLVLSDKHVREGYSELKNPDIENIVNDQNKINQYTEELKKSKNNLLAIVKIIGSFRGKKWLFAIATVVIIFLIRWLATTIFKEEYENITKFLSVQSAALIAFVTNLWKYSADARKNITQAHDKMVSLQKTFDDRPEENNEKVNELKENKKQLETDLKKIEDDLTKTKKDIEDVESGRMLLDFVEQRSKDTNYASQLGLISWIRKDFENLTRLLSGQDAALSAARKGKPGEKEPDVVLKVDRIILYIDDLDRCNEDLVVKVLEAIHLILAFDLFVVVVGVDPRWLNNALNEKYKLLFGVPGANGQLKKKEKARNGKTNEEPGNKISEEAEIKISDSILDAATSYDYLEKIFQIPFCLKPINETGRKKLIGYLLDRGNKQEEKASQDPKGNVDPKDHTPPLVDGPAEITPVITQVPASAAPLVEGKEIKIPATENKIDKADIKTTPQKKFDPPIRVNFTEDEKNFMKKMSILFGQSPRSITRYVNIYRIIKAHKGFIKPGEYAFEKYAPTLFLLGVVVGHSVYASDFIDAINQEKDGTKFKSFIKKRTLNKDLVKEIVKCSDDKLWEMQMVNYKRDLNLISRFSFRTLIDE